MEDGRRRTIALLDVVDVPLGPSCPLPYQPENVALADGPIELLRVADRQRVLPWLRSRARTSGGLLGRPESRAISVETASKGLSQSLDLVLVAEPVFFRDPERSWQVRVAFDSGGVRYEVSVTDPVLRSRAPKVAWEPGGEWLFVVSITEPWRGAHWLLVAGCIELG